MGVSNSRECGWVSAHTRKRVTAKRHEDTGREQHAQVQPPPPLLPMPCAVLPTTRSQSQAIPIAAGSPMYSRPRPRAATDGARSLRNRNADALLDVYAGASTTEHQSLDTSPLPFRNHAMFELNVYEQVKSPTGQATAFALMSGKHVAFPRRNVPPPPPVTIATFEGHWN